MKKKIFVVETHNLNQYEDSVNNLLSEGWQILSTSSGIVNSEAYNFCAWFQAVMEHPGEPVATERCYTADELTEAKQWGYLWGAFAGAAASALGLFLFSQY